jgi:cytochrome c peroxidase
MKKMLMFALIALSVFMLCFSITNKACAGNSANAKSLKNKENLIKLGKKLYYAKIMAGNTMSCATCHIYSVDTYTYCGRKGGLMTSLNNINKKLAERNRIKHTNLTLRDITKKCFKIITGKHLSSGEIHALDAYVRKR